MAKIFLILLLTMRPRTDGGILLDMAGLRDCTIHIFDMYSDMPQSPLLIQVVSEIIPYNYPVTITEYIYWESKNYTNLFPSHLGWFDLCSVNIILPAYCFHSSYMSLAAYEQRINNHNTLFIMLVRQSEVESCSITKWDLAGLGNALHWSFALSAHIIAKIISDDGGKSTIKRMYVYYAHFVVTRSFASTYPIIQNVFQTLPHCGVNWSQWRRIIRALT